jgi:hypothetical protein
MKRPRKKLRLPSLEKYGILCLPDGFLGDLDSIDHAVQSVAGSLHCPELTARYLRQLEKLLVIPENYKPFVNKNSVSCIYCVTDSH